MRGGPEQHLGKSQAGIGPFSRTNPAGYPTAFDVSPGRIVMAWLYPGPITWGSNQRSPSAWALLDTTGM